MINYVRNICKRTWTLLIFLCIAILVQLIGCNSSNKVERGDLPYYNNVNPIFTRAEAPTVENVYPYEDAAAIVSYIGGPRYYENNIALEPGSNEEAIFLKTGTNLTNSYYEYTVKILQVLDDKKHDLKSDETINIRCGIRNSGYDPFNIYIKQNSKQNFLLVFYKGDIVNDDTFYYITKIQYYEKDGVLYSTNKNEEFEKYSGMTTDEFAETLKKIK